MARPGEIDSCDLYDLQHIHHSTAVEQALLERAHRAVRAAQGVWFIGVKALLVAREKISAGLSDGRVATYGYRDLDGSGDQIWVLERVMEASGGRKSAVTSMTACGHNMLLCAADEGAYLYA